LLILAPRRRAEQAKTQTEFRKWVYSVEAWQIQHLEQVGRYSLRGLGCGFGTFGPKILIECARGSPQDQFAVRTIVQMLLNVTRYRRREFPF
jgi:hypothetical protein